MEKEIIKKVWPQWTVQRKLGTGAFGQVYEAVHTKFNVEDRSAIKVIPVPARPDEVDAVRAEGRSLAETRQYFRGIVDEFVKEIQLMISLDGSSNIVSVKDYDVVEKEGGIGWYVLIRMELLTPYERYVQTHPFNEKDVIKLGCDICNALEMCAKQKIIHRDIKPANIMVHERTGNFKLGDFGVARKLENTTNGMTVAGARNYIAPEIMCEQKYDHRVDIYSLGLVLYRAANRNRMPFVPTTGPVTHADASEAVRRRISGERLPPPCDASPELAKVILRACAHKPEDRFASAAEMKQALERVMDSGCQSVKRVEKPGTNGKSEDALILTENQDVRQTVRVRRTPEERHSAEQNGTIRVRRAPEAKNNDAAQKTSAAQKAASAEASRKKQSPVFTNVMIGALCAIVVLVIAVWGASGGFLRIYADVQNRLGSNYYFGTGVGQDYAEAVKRYRKAAEVGYAVAQNNLGNCYYSGKGTEQNYEEAVKWYRKAAEQGYANAQYNLGHCYQYGYGVAQDYAEAVKWHRKAAEQGFALGQYNLGHCYQYGKGVAQDYDEAVKWYRKAAEQGSAAAQNNLGYCYHNGLGVGLDDNEAMKWFRKAAEQGNATAQYNLGNCYQYGWGVTKNKTEAISWYRKAAAQGYEKAKEQLKELGVSQ